jgi:hypothetical protein
MSPFLFLTSHTPSAPSAHAGQLLFYMYSLASLLSVTFLFLARILKHLLEAEKSNFREEGVFSKIEKYNRAQTDYIFCEFVSINILFEKIKTNFN